MTVPGDEDQATHAERPIVLLVDDNVGFLRVLRAVLERGTPAFTVATVGTGHEALSYLRAERPFAEAMHPHFVILDFHLPDIDAPDVLDLLRSSPHATDVPVLVLSQADWREDEVAALGAGARAFRAKPSSLDELRAIVVDFWNEHVRLR